MKHNGICDTCLFSKGICKMNECEIFRDDTGQVADCEKYKKNNMKYKITITVCETGRVKKEWYSNTVPKETDVSSEIETSEEFKAFSDMRKKAKRPLTDKAAKMIISKLNKLAPDDYETQKEILNQSTMNGWRGVFPLHEEKQPKGYIRTTEERSYDIDKIIADARNNTEIRY